MNESAILLEQQQFGDWAWLTLGSAALAAARPGQFVALRRTVAGSFDPLLREPLFVAAAEPQAGLCRLLVARTHPAWAFLSGLPRGAALDVLGPLGHGWQVDATARMVALLGTAGEAAALFGLAHWAVGRGLSVTMLLGADATLSAPAPFLLPAAAEYNIADGADAAVAARSLLDDQLLRWADLLALALPSAQLPALAQQIRRARIQWGRGFAQAAVLETGAPQLACCVGVCGGCAVETRRGMRLACVDGPVVDLHDLVR